MIVNYLTSNSHVNVNEPHVMALGFFDGVHLGHQQLFIEANMIAHGLGVKSSIFTFSSHPSETIHHETNRKYITPLQEKLKKIASCGVDAAYVMTFDLALASLSPLDFIKRYIVDMNVRHVVVGFDFTFGSKAAGNISTLQTYAEKYNFGLTVIPKKTYQNGKISSTATRHLLEEGHVEQIRSYLGEDYEIKTTVQQLLSINRAYLMLNDPYILPKKGVYHVLIQKNDKLYPAELDILSSKNGACVIESLDLLLYENMELDLLFLNKIDVREVVLA